MSLDADNPFAPGSADPHIPHGAPGGSNEPVPLEPMAVLNRSWEIFQANMGLTIGVLVATLVISLGFAGVDVLLSVVEESADEQTAMMLNAVGLVLSLMSFAVSLFLQLGSVQIFMRLAQGKHAELGMLIGQGSYFLSMIALSILSTLGVIFGALFLIVPGVILGLGIQFSVQTLLDRDLGPIEALKASWQLTDGHKMTLFAISLVFIFLAMILSCFTCGLGYLLIIPVLSLAQGVMYHSLTHLEHDATMM
jgi:uncharacterized membrane protein